MAESQTATILVTDLVGSTELRVRLGEEGADVVRRAHNELLRAAIEAERGTVIKGLGDGVLAMFASASDAVAAAVRVQQAAYAYGRKTPGERLEIRVGLSAGDVSLEDGDCFGTPVVEASRLCAGALGGQILAAELVRLLARGRRGHVFTAAGERELKGLPDPVAVVIVGWDPPDAPGSGVSFPARLAPRAALPFSGRGEQFETLMQAWKEAAGGERGVVLVSGEPGIGKTRLAAQVAREAHDLGAVVLFGRCDEDLGVPFQPFVEALRQVVQSGLTAGVLGRYGGDLVRLVPGLDQAVAGLAPPLQADPETERYRLFDAVTAWLGALSSEVGVVLVLDDLQWADKTTLLLLRHVVRSSEPMRSLVLGTYRDTDLNRAHPLAEVLADLRREATVARVALSGLDVSGVRELLANAGGENLDARSGELAQRLWSETEGNPFFVGEILRSLVESGRLVQREGTWTSDVEVSELGIPEGVREVVGRRLSRLSGTANAVLALGSVIGAVIDVDVLVAVADVGEDAVLDALDEASAASLLRETATGAYEFTHALVRSTLYDELSGRRRARRHRQVAECLERRDSSDVAALAYHFGRAGGGDIRAVDYAAAAGDQALEVFAADQAAAFFTRALEAVDDVGSGADRRCALLIRLGTAQRLAGVPSSRETLLEAARLAQDLGDADLLAQAALANNRGSSSGTSTVDDERVRVLEAALDGIGPTDSATRARLLSVLALEVMWNDPELRRLELGDEAVAIARRLGDDACLLDVWTASYYSGSVVERFSALAAEVPALMELAERVGDAAQLGLACEWGFDCYMEMGELDAADRLLDRLGQIASEFNNPVLWWVEALLRGCRLAVFSTGDEIELAALNLLQLGQDAGQPDAFLLFSLAFCNARWAQGRLAETVDLLRQGVADNPGLPVFRAYLAMTLALVAEFDEAAGLVDDFMADPDNAFPNDPSWPSGHYCLGEAVAAVGTPVQAAREYAILAPHAGRLVTNGVFAYPSVSLTLAKLAARAGRPVQAEQHFADVHDQHERLGAPDWLARTQLAWGHFLLDTGQTGRARTLLSLARDAGERTGAADVVTAADSLLADIAGTPPVKG